MSERLRSPPRLVTATHVSRVAASSDRVNLPERACALSREHPLREVTEVHDAGRVRVRQIEVSDDGQVAVKPNPTLGAHGDRGFRIIDTLADDWGVPEVSTKVWFRLDRPPGEP